ncbi:MAG: flagellar M-ring protein FliF [Candidatus Riflebacteria bacterium]|nr:flagellar M-ring protein FliF [Candidatus Riflebacteria bacterium]
MTEFFKQLWLPISKLSRAQQFILLATFAAVILFITTAIIWGGKTEYIPLFEEELKAEEAAAINSKLAELGLNYKLGSKPGEFLVPLADKSYILLQLTEHKVMPQAKPGWTKLIDQRSIFSGTTKQEFELNYIRGLQVELETALEKMAPIKKANVNIVVPQKHVFQEDQREPTASVLLHFKPGQTLNQEQIKGIRGWLCRAVEGLLAENIKILDSNANDLTSLIEDDEIKLFNETQARHLKITTNREKSLKDRLTKILQRVFGVGNVEVTVFLDMDFDKKEALRDLVIPLEGTNSGIVLSEKLENEEYKGKDLVEDGEPGVNSNLPPGMPAYPSTDEGTYNEYKRAGTTRNYKISQSKEKYIKEQGSIRRMTASVVISGDPEQLKAIEDKITAIAQTAIGFDKERGDKITVMITPFESESAKKAQRALELKRLQEKKMFKISIAVLLSIPILLGLIYILSRLSRARAIAKEQRRLQDAELRDAELNRLNGQQNEYSQSQREFVDSGFQNIPNLFPGITDPEEKNNKLQELRIQAYRYAMANDALPPNFENMTPEEKYIFKEAFTKKAEGSLAAGLENLEAIYDNREKLREEELARLDSEAHSREELEQRIRELVSSKPEDAIKVMRLWLANS